MSQPTNPQTVCESCGQAPENTVPVMAEVARLQAEAILALLQRDNQVNYRSHPALVSRSPVPSIPTDLPTGMLISSSTGSISIADWEVMSEVRLRRLDTALKTIVDTAMVEGVSFPEVGLIIQRELEEAGFVFNTVCDTTKYQDTGGGKEAEDESLSDLVRVRAARRGAVAELGNAIWVEEMLRITVRLMELRGISVGW